jgi:hypothetical protein|tara:strand:+ start:551 stop:1165 length:615 start_codon:yes stop_codon:yes gene_type:complete
MAKLKDIINENFSTLGGIATIKPVNTISSTSLSGLVEDKWFGEDEKKVDTGEFMQEVKNFSRLGEMIYREGSLRDVAKGLAELADKARVATLQETDDWFDKVTINKNMKQLGAASSDFTKIAKEASSLQQRMESLYEDMGHILGRYYDLDEAMDKVDPDQIEPEDDFEDRTDKDIDNDGDTDDSDEYLHNRRKAIAKAIAAKKK